MTRIPYVPWPGLGTLAAQQPDLTSARLAQNVEQILLLGVRTAGGIVQGQIGDIQDQSRLTAAGQNLAAETRRLQIGQLALTRADEQMATQTLQRSTDEILKVQRQQAALADHGLTFDSLRQFMGEDRARAWLSGPGKIANSTYGELSLLSLGQGESWWRQTGQQELLREIQARQENAGGPLAPLPDYFSEPDFAGWISDRVTAAFPNDGFARAGALKDAYAHYNGLATASAMQSAEDQTKLRIQDLNRGANSHLFDVLNGTANGGIVPDPKDALSQIDAGYSEFERVGKVLGADTKPATYARMVFDQLAGLGAEDVKKIGGALLGDGRWRRYFERGATGPSGATTDVRDLIDAKESQAAAKQAKDQTVLQKQLESMLNLASAQAAPGNVDMSAPFSLIGERINDIADPTTKANLLASLLKAQQAAAKARASYSQAHLDFAASQDLTSGKVSIARYSPEVMDQLFTDYTQPDEGGQVGLDVPSFAAKMSFALPNSPMPAKLIQYVKDGMGPGTTPELHRDVVRTVLALSPDRQDTLLSQMSGVQAEQLRQAVGQIREMPQDKWQGPEADAIAQMWLSPQAGAALTEPVYLQNADGTMQVDEKGKPTRVDSPSVPAVYTGNGTDFAPWLAVNQARQENISTSLGIKPADITAPLMDEWVTTFNTEYLKALAAHPDAQPSGISKMAETAALKRFTAEHLKLYDPHGETVVAKTGLFTAAEGVSDKQRRTAIESMLRSASFSFNGNSRAAVEDAFTSPTDPLLTMVPIVAYPMDTAADPSAYLKGFVVWDQQSGTWGYATEGGKPVSVVLPRQQTISAGTGAPGVTIEVAGGQALVEPLGGSRTGPAADREKNRQYPANLYEDAVANGKAEGINPMLAYRRKPGQAEYVTENADAPIPGMTMTLRQYVAGAALASARVQLGHTPRIFKPDTMPPEPVDSLDTNEDYLAYLDALDRIARSLDFAGFRRAP